MEYFDLLDSSGSPTGKTASRTECHKHGHFHRTVHVWILNSKNELLLQKRHFKKDTNPGLWDISAAGHLSAGQTSLEAAKNECLEELGINIDILKSYFLFTVKNSFIDPITFVRDCEFQDVYLVREDFTLEDFTIQKSEVSDLDSQYSVHSTA